MRIIKYIRISVCGIALLFNSCDHHNIRPDAPTVDHSLIGSWLEHSIDTSEKLTFTNTQYFSERRVDVMKFNEAGTYYIIGDKLYLQGQDDHTFKVYRDTLEITTIYPGGFTSSVLYNRIIE